MSHASLLLRIALLLAPALAVAHEQNCPQLFLGGTAPALANPRLAQGVVMLCNDAFAVAASGITRGALWSAEHPTAASLQAARDVPRRGKFHADRRLAPGARGELEDYRNSGLDRGHMTPSGDMPDSRSQQQTFSLANMVPQTAALNRGLWEGIETSVRQLTEREGELFVVTGPAFEGGQISAIGPDGVLVPTSIWKAVYDPTAGTAASYICGNTGWPSCQVVPIPRLTAITGINPFPALSEAAKLQTLQLPPPENGTYAEGPAPHRNRSRRLLDQPLSR